MTILYPDISHYQAGLSLAGAPLVVTKATQGTGYVDPTYAGFKAQAATRRIRLAAYHWLDTTDPVAQARHAYATVGATPLMIDDEQGRVNVSHTAQFVAAYRDQGGVCHMEYLPRWVWQDSGSPDLRPLVGLGMHLVASNYSAGYATSSPGWAPYGGMTPAVLQWTDKQVFNGKPCDFNTFFGTADALWALFTGDDMAGFDAAAEKQLADAYWQATNAIDLATGGRTTVSGATSLLVSAVKALQASNTTLATAVKALQAGNAATTAGLTALQASIHSGQPLTDEELAAVLARADQVAEAKVHAALEAAAAASAPPA